MKITNEVNVQLTFQHAKCLVRKITLGKYSKCTKNRNKIDKFTQFIPVPRVNY